MIHDYAQDNTYVPELVEGEGVADFDLFFLSTNMSLSISMGVVGAVCGT